MEPALLFAASECELEFEIEIFLFLGIVCLVSFWHSFFLGGATAAALKPKAVVDGNSSEVLDHVASFPAHLINRGPDQCAVCASPLRYR